MSSCDTNKVSIIGCGKVGMSAAYSILHRGEVSELVLHGRKLDEIIGEELDLEHGMSFLPYTKIKATDDYKDIAGSDIVVITAGAAQKPGETRLDLTQKNVAIIESIIPEVVKHAPEAVILIVSNPVDILTYRAYQIAGLPKGRIFGSGTTLDTARFRFHLSEFLHVNPQSIHAYILGEHGDSSFPALSSASIGGQPLMTMDNFSEERAWKAYDKARDAAYKIIQSKGATYYGIGTVISYIVSKILRDSRSILPVSVPLHQYYGYSGVALSVPSIIGRSGVTESLEIKLDWEEKRRLEKSVVTLKQYL
jgi:L-lactate dehydrogenase